MAANVQNLFNRTAASPHTYGVRKTRIAVRIPTEPFSPDGLVRGRNGVTCYRSRVLVGLAVCRMWCINAKKMVV